MEFLRNHLLWSVYIPALLLSFGTGMLVPVLPLYVRSFETSYALVGLVLAAQGIGTLVGDVPSGVILGKLGHKWAMVVGVGTAGFFMLAMSWAQLGAGVVCLMGWAAGSAARCGTSRATRI